MNRLHYRVIEVSRAIAKAYEGKVRPSQIDRLLLAITERDLVNYRNFYFEISDRIEAGRELKKLRNLEEKLRGFSPDLLKNLKASYQEPQWEERLADFENAWKWAQANRWIRKFSDANANERLSRELEEARRTISRIIRDLSVSLSWGHFFERLRVRTNAKT